jgi:hypothetical protein
MTLGDHKQETEKKEKEKLTRLDWDVNPGYRSTKSSGRLDWGINTAEKTLYTHDNGRDQEKPPLHPPDRISASIEPPKEKNHHRWRSRGAGNTTSKGPPPCRTQHRSTIASKPSTRRHEDHRVRSLSLSRARGHQPATQHASLSRAQGPPTHRTAHALDLS